MDDSNPDFKTQQSAHAERLRTERDLSRAAGGISRTEVREALQGFRQDVERRRIERDLLSFSVPAAPKPPAFTTEIQTFAPKSFTIGEEGGTAPAGGGNQTGPPGAGQPIRAVLLVMDADGNISQQTVEFNGLIVT